jgi:RimJ/RimL family protein N-acetyltransferase
MEGMTFLKQGNVELRLLEGDESDARTWSSFVNRGLTTQMMFTGSIPMRSIDAQEVWKKERANGSVIFGIWLKDDHGEKFIGDCGLYSHRDIYKSWEFRILIFDPDCVGHKIGHTATILVTQYAFDRLNAHRVWLGVVEDNLRAIKCYLDAGYRIEGRLVDDAFFGGKYHSVIRMGAIQNEWNPGPDIR